MILLKLFWEFFKTGLFAVGGGMATVPFLQQMGEKTGWFTSLQLADMIAVADSTPGPIGVNMAVYTGFTVSGVLGALVALLGLITPSVIIILIVARVLDAFKDSFFIKSAFYGLRPASMGLIASAGCTVLTMSVLCLPFESVKTLFNIKALILFAALVVLTRVKPLKKLHPIVFIALSALFGVAFKL
ncbi:MAG: chromate transporter [Clostridia bacterium]|nr:chromate transporter [Clostridia bacterium]